MAPVTQRWHGLGLIFSPDRTRSWQHSHASLPLAAGGLDGSFNVYFASRDEGNRSHVGRVEIDLRDTVRSPSADPNPILEPGPLGSFDDHGVYPASLVAHEGTDYLYYIGWNPGRTEPMFYSSIGLALSDDGGKTFRKRGRAPIIARGEFDPCLVTSPCVIIDGGLWRMWYVSGYRWDRGADGTPRSWYHIKYAESDDGVEWRREGRVCIDHEHPGERNIGRPCVVKADGGYRMWFSYAGDFPYRLGYAESEDGLEWTRLDELLEFEHDSDWDSESRAYPWVVESGGELAMLYNGNAQGRAGFGLARQH